MANSNVELLEPIYAEWERGDWATVPEPYAADMEWGWSDEWPGLEGVSRDPEIRSTRLRQWLSEWENWRCEAERYVTTGDQVVAICRYRGIGKKSGAAVDQPGAHLWRFRAGEIIRLEIFNSPERALAAAGLGEPGGG
jgi:ketosteroid isomerase-like protein